MKRKMGIAISLALLIPALGFSGCDNSSSDTESSISSEDIVEITFIQLEQFTRVNHDGYYDPVFIDNVISETKIDFVRGTTLDREETIDLTYNQLNFVPPSMTTYYIFSGFYPNKENPHYSERFNVGDSITQHEVWYYGMLG